LPTEEEEEEEEEEEWSGRIPGQLGMAQIY